MFLVKSGEQELYVKTLSSIVMATEPKFHPSKHGSALCQVIIYGAGTEAFRAVLKALWVGMNQMSSPSFMKGGAALRFSKTHFTATKCCAPFLHRFLYQPELL